MTKKKRSNLYLYKNERVTVIYHVLASLSKNHKTLLIIASKFSDRERQNQTFRYKVK